jgi:alkanesulfonate monooxygenase SsuD/methylene tetrahydromethanopterin reductase-like flavin-dependent oxidoreductase (luciferase family)
VIKVGVKLPTRFEDVGEWLADARAYEAAGVDALWFSETLIRPLVSERPTYPPELDPWTLLAAIAAVTTRVRLGTTVSVVAMWPPVLFAIVANTLDHLSRGRLIVGAGAGWEPAQFAAIGLGFGDRGRRLDEFLEVVRRCWSGSREPFDGGFYQLPALRVAAAAREGGPPIFIGAFSEPGFRRAARFGGFICGGGGPERADREFRRVLELRRAAGLEGDFELWAQVRQPQGREQWRETLEAFEKVGATGVIVATNERLLDILRNPDVEEDRSDLRIAAG